MINHTVKFNTYATQLHPVLSSSLRTAYIRATNTEEAAAALNYILDTEYYTASLFFECPDINKEPACVPEGCVFCNFDKEI